MSDRRFLQVSSETFEAWKSGTISDDDFKAAVVTDHPFDLDEFKALVDTTARTPRLSKRHQKVLLAMAEYDREEQISPLRTLAIDTGIDFHLVRIAVRALTRRGFAKLTRGLMTVDGEFCGGSGYGLTIAGREMAAKIGGAK